MDLFCALNTPGTVAFGIEIDKIEDIKELGDSWIYEGISDSVNENWGEFTESMIAAKILYDKKEALATKANSQVDLDDLAVEAIKEVFGDIEASFTIDDSDVELSFDIDFNEAVAVACFDSLFGWYQNHEIKIGHNFDGKKFKWLYAKYAYGANPNHHCTNAIKGKYSKKFSRNNKAFVPEQTIVLDEYKELGWDAIYICGVSTKGYAKHENYPHNVHVAILPAPGEKDEWSFEDWSMTVENGRFEYVISEEELNPKYKILPEEYVTCRMFRWAVWHYRKQLGDE